MVDSAGAVDGNQVQLCKKLAYFLLVSFSQTLLHSGPGDLHQTQYDKFRKAAMITDPRMYMEGTHSYTLALVSVL